MKFFVALAFVVACGLGSAQTTITYWQYDFASRIDAMNQLIEQFQEANPDVTVVQETFPYDAYQQRVAAATAAGEGPDVVQLFYGWAAAWQRAGYVEPIPQDKLSHEWIESYFIPMAQAGKIGGEYYGLPTAVRALALFYNKDMMAAAGLDPSMPPTTWDEFVAAAQAMTVKRGPLFSQIGYGPGGQDHHLIRTVLTTQLGATPYSADGTTVQYGGDAGAQALATWTKWQTEDEIGVLEFVPGGSGYREGFINLETIGMIVDGSFALGNVRANAGFDWGVAELPTFDNGVKANFGSYWMNGLGPAAFESDAKLDASVRFMQFVTSPEAMQLWLEVVGELPAAASLIADASLRSDPVYGPFIAGLAYAEATQFVDEGAQRQIMLDAYNRVLLEGMDPAESMAIAAEADQALIDEFNQP